MMDTPPIQNNNDFILFIFYFRSNGITRLMKQRYINMKTLEEIKKEIHTINPDITDALLDLLYEYVSIRQHENMLDFVNNYSSCQKELKKIVYDSLSHNNS